MLIHIQSDAYSPPHSIEGKFFFFNDPQETF